MALKFLLLSLLISSAVTASQCSPKKSNPKNEQCAKDLMKDGIGSLPSDLQSQLMEPLVSSLAKKLTKDLMDDMNDCQPKKPEQCGGTSDIGKIAKPSSEEGKKMFKKATNDLQENGIQLLHAASNKAGELEKQLGDYLTGNFKKLLGGLPGNLTGTLPNLLENTSNAFKGSFNGLRNKFEEKIGSALLGGSMKQMEGLKKTVNEMPEGGLDFINKQLKEKSADLVNKTLGKMNGEMKGLVDGFTGALGLESLNLTGGIDGMAGGLKGMNGTGNGLGKKLDWLTNKISSVADQYGNQFGLGLTAATGGVFGAFLAGLPKEFKADEEVISLLDMISLPQHLLEAINQTEEARVTTTPEPEVSSWSTTTYPTPKTTPSDYTPFPTTIEPEY